MTTPQQVQKEIAQTLNITDLSEEDQKQIIAQMGEVVLGRVSAEILSDLSTEKQEEFEKLSREGDQVKMGAFLNTEVEGLDSKVKAVVEDEVRRFKEATS